MQRRFKAWANSSVFKCYLCNWTGTVTSRYTHLIKMHRMQFKDYKQRYGSKLFIEKEHECKICHINITLDDKSLYNHFKRWHEITAVEYYKTYIDGLMVDSEEELRTSELMDERDRFKKWCDSSLFKCAICHWIGSVTLFSGHTTKVHKMTYGVYRKKYGSGLHDNKEHECEICDKTIRLDYFSVYHHFKTKHSMIPLEYYKKYVCGQAEGYMAKEDGGAH